jgi:hypothetical protein
VWTGAGHAQVYGALEYLQVPDLTPADILFFVRSVSGARPHVSYSEFIEVPSWAGARH